MRGLLLLLVVVAVASAKSVERKRRYADGYGRIGMVESRVFELSGKLRDLEKELEKRVSGSTAQHDQLAAFERRLAHVVGNHCKEDEFQCGGDQPECVNNLLVCDGTKDCRNGHDEEDDDTCKNKAPEGSAFRGFPVHDECSNRRPIDFTVVVTDVHESNIFPGRLDVEATIVLNSETKDSHTAVSLPTHGNYCFATSTLTLEPPEADRLGVELVFDRNKGGATAYIYREASHERCAKFVLNRS